MVILHTAAACDGRNYVVVEYAPKLSCRWYEARRLVLAETDGTPYYQTNGRNVIRIFKDISYHDVRSRSVGWEYRGMVERLKRKADELAQEVITPSGTLVLTAVDLEAAANAAGGMK